MPAVSTAGREWGLAAPFATYLTALRSELARRPLTTPVTVSAPSSNSTRATVATADVEVWVPSAAGGIDQLVQRGGMPASGDQAVRDAYANGVKVLEYFQKTFGRNSWDNKGTVLKLRVHAPNWETGKPNNNNAGWFLDEGRIWLGDGDGKLFSPLGGAPDVIAHEFTHAVIDSEVKLRYTGQEGAIHESFSDVLATGIDGNWQIAEGVFTPGIAGDALRDLAHPTWSNYADLPAGMDEEHALSEVASTAAYKAAQAIGADVMRSIWYTAIVDHMPNHAGFAGARQATIDAANALFGKNSNQSQAVRDAWAAVGVSARTPKLTRTI